MDLFLGDRSGSLLRLPYGAAGCQPWGGTGFWPPPSPLDLLHSLAGDWLVSDRDPPDDTFKGLKIHADGNFYCTKGPVEAGEITVVNAAVREVHLMGNCGSLFTFSVTPDGRHMAGKHMMTNVKWHLEKRTPKLLPASTVSSNSKSLGSERSSTSEITQQKLRELIREAWKAGRASAGSMASSDSSATRTAHHNTIKNYEEFSETGSEHCPVIGQVQRRRKGTEAQQRELSKDITNCKSAKAILQKLTTSIQSGIDPNSVCLSTAAHRVARLNGEQEAPRNKIFDIVARDISKHGVSGWDAQGLSKILWACATANYKTPELFGAAEDFAHHEGLTSFRSQHLAYLVWSFSMSGHKTSLLYEKVDNEIIRRGLGSFNSQDICMTLKGFSAAGHKGVCFYRVAEAEIAKRGFGPFNTQEVGSILASFVGVGQRFRQVLQAVNNYRHIEQCGAAALAGIIRCVAALLSHEPVGSRPYLCANFFENVGEEVGTRLANDSSSFSPSHLVSVAWGYAKSGLTTSPLLRTISTHLLNRGLGSLTGQDLSHLAAAFTPDLRVTTSIATEVVTRGGMQLNSTEFTLLVNALGLDALNTVEACQILSKTITVKKMRYFKDGELVGCFKTLCGMGVVGEGFVKKAGAEIRKRSLKGLDTAGCATVAKLFAKWGVQNVVEMAAAEVERRPMRGFAPSELVTFMTAFLTVGLKSKVPVIYEEVLRRPATAFTPQHLTDILHCLHKISHPPTQLLRRIEVDVMSRGYTLYGRSATTIVMLFLSEVSPPAYQDWPAICSWIPLPPSVQPNVEIVAAIRLLRYTPVVKMVVGKVTWNITVPELRVVIEDTSRSLPDTTLVDSNTELMSRVLGHEGWTVIPLDWARFKGDMQLSLATLGELLAGVMQEVPVLVHVSDEDDSEGTPGECSSAEVATLM